jgi:hypothetical protein
VRRLRRSESNGAVTCRAIPGLGIGTGLGFADHEFGVSSPSKVDRSLLRSRRRHGPRPIRRAADNFDNSIITDGLQNPSPAPEPPLAHVGPDFVTKRTLSDELQTN